MFYKTHKHAKSAHFNLPEEQKAPNLQPEGPKTLRHGSETQKRQDQQRDLVVDQTNKHIVCLEAENVVILKS